MNDSHEIVENGFLLLQDGAILEIGQGERRTDARETEVTDLRGAVIMPGLINAHSHSYGNLVKGTSENLPLELWMLHTLSEGKHFSGEDAYVSSLLGAVEMLKTGTTAFLDHQPQPLESLLQSAKAYKKVGIRALIVPQFGNKPYEETLSRSVELASPPVPKPGVEPYMEMTRALIESLEGRDERIRCGVGPSGPQRCSDPLLLASYELAEEFDVPWHTHVLETKAQQATAKNFYGKRMIEHLNNLGVLSSRCSLAHVVWAAEEEVTLLADNSVCIAHNPMSNLLLGSGLMPLIKFREAGVRVALGTDGANCCGFQSMFESMKLAATLSNTYTPDFSRWVSAAEVMEMSTKNGAHALGMADRLGSLEAGKEADFVVVDHKASALVPLNDLVWQIVYGRTDLFVSDVYVGGEKVVENGRVTTVDEDELYDEALRTGERLMDRLKTDRDRVRGDLEKVKGLLNS
jgi:guanine deaminase